MPRCSKKKKWPGNWVVDGARTATPISFEEIQRGYYRAIREPYLGRSYGTVEVRSNPIRPQRPAFIPWFQSTPARDAEALETAIEELETEE